MPSADERSLATRGRALADDVKVRFERLEQSNIVVELLADGVRRYLRTNAGLLAGSLAYRIFLVLVPAMLVVVAVLGSAASGGVDIEDEVGSEMRLGSALASSLQTAGEDASRGWQVVLLIGLFGVLTGASSLYSAMHRSFAQVWEIPPTSVKRTAKARVRFIGGFLLFVIFLVFMAWVRRLGTVLGLAGVILLAAMALILFVGLSFALPRRAEDPLQLVPGALVGGIAIIGLQVFSAVWLPRQVASYSSTYGAIGIAVALLVYLALLGNILVLVPVVNATWWDHVAAERTPESVGRLLDRLRSHLPGALAPGTMASPEGGGGPDSSPDQPSA